MPWIHSTIQLTVVQATAASEPCVADDGFHTSLDDPYEVCFIFVGQTCLEYLWHKKVRRHDETSPTPGDIQNPEQNFAVVEQNLLPVQDDLESIGFMVNDVNDIYLQPLRIFDTVVNRINKVCPSRT